ncbi:transketolase C-terminal domain-containing protein [Streptomyces sp. NBC_00996]|uniref:transketolase C-terminal domain-containing protein n=1 Tax=Streptomyces sp. NBC_00996 TaxID=2903710 RepID=UPI00386F190D|nr:hypothetical protein OG390_45195 [Streptomyces sp. NBC_00996]
MVPVALQAAERLAGDGVSAEVIDLRCLVPLDTRTVLASVAKTSRLVTVEENPYQGGWGGTLVSVVVDEGFGLLDAPVCRVAPRTRRQEPGLDPESRRACRSVDATGPPQPPIGPCGRRRRLRRPGSERDGGVPQVGRAPNSGALLGPHFAGRREGSP